MNLEEKIEKAFYAGVNWCMKNSYCDIKELKEIVTVGGNPNTGFIEYINGNPEPSKSTPILD